MYLHSILKESPLILYVGVCQDSSFWLWNHILWKGFERWLRWVLMPAISRPIICLNSPALRELWIPSLLMWTLWWAKRNWNVKHKYLLAEIIHARIYDKIAVYPVKVWRMADHKGSAVTGSPWASWSIPRDQAKRWELCYQIRISIEIRILLTSYQSIAH